jgi:DNA repair protein RadC
MYEYTFKRRKVAEAPMQATTAAAIVRAIWSAFHGAESERLVVVALDVHQYISGFEVVYTGNVSAALVRVGELFRFPVRVNAARVILAHNHPSGDTTPSMEDTRLTAMAVEAGKLLDIPVLDHIIIGDGVWTSMRDLGTEFGR